MADGVKKERARATRRKIIAAATDLFVAQGYAATKLEDVAARAGVAVQTVYFHFTNKRTLLKEAVDVASAGDDEPVALLDRPYLAEIRAEPDGRRALAAWMSLSRAIFERVAPIMAVVRDASGTDPDVADQWRVSQDQRAVAHRELAALLDAKGALKPGLTLDRAGDIIFTIVSPEVFMLLTVERGWSPAEWESFVTGTVTDAVLA
jgi:AcrR family transcriptional regulator